MHDPLRDACGTLKAFFSDFLVPELWFHPPDERCERCGRYPVHQALDHTIYVLCLLPLFGRQDNNAFSRPSRSTRANPPSAALFYSPLHPWCRRAPGQVPGAGGGSVIMSPPTYSDGVYFYDVAEALLHDHANDSGGITCVDLKVVQRQRRAISDLIREMGRHLLKGQVNLINVSMPVTFFEARSYLQKLTDPWIYPAMLDKAAAASADPVERMKWVMTFFIAGMQHVFATWAKPFNPILGETWQGELSDGSTVFLEQISHHPPVSAWYMEAKDSKESKGPSWRFVGTSNPQVSFKWNSLTTIPSGFRRIEFPRDKGCIELHFPSYVINNVIRGTPQGLLKGEMSFIDNENNLEGVIHFAPVKGDDDHLLAREDALWGGITDKGVQTGRSKGWFRGRDDGAMLKKSKSFRKGHRPKGDGIYSVVSGNWLSHADFDGVRYWTLHEENEAVTGGWKGWKEVAKDAALPSDSRFREDLDFLRKDNKAGSQKWKADLEERQRNDRKAREEGWKTYMRREMPKHDH